MLIIFDLDDTLIDTSGCITPFALENALRAMVAAGLSLSSFSEALQLLKRINKMAYSSREALAEFIEILGGDAAHLEVGKQQLCGACLPADLPIFPLDGAVEVLTELSYTHELTIVTIGKLSLQMEKLKKAGIDSAFFSKIIVSEDGNKKNHFTSLQKEFDYLPNEIIACGDRFASDLAPAKELGFKTVHIKWGRGLNNQVKKSDVDYQINTLNELKDIISYLMTFSTF